MSTYLIIDLLILAGPLILTLLPQTAFWKKLPAVFLTFLIVGGLFVVVDIFAAHYGVWSWNKQYILDIWVINIPLEEVLFFFVTTYSCLYIYEVVEYLFPFHLITAPTGWYLFVINMLGTIFLFTVTHAYTAGVIFFAIIIFNIVWHWLGEALKDQRFWLFILISYVPFFFFNYLLTSFPILIYNQAAIFGTRITTIPLEDFLYSFIMVMLYGVVYQMLKTRMLRKAAPRH